MKIEVHRAWKTRDNWHLETKMVVIASGVIPSRREHSEVERTLQIAFATDAAGGGASRFIVSIPPDRFIDLLRAMMKANPGAALKAFDVAREAAVIMRTLGTDAP